jgi:hypothetical protein
MAKGHSSAVMVLSRFEIAWFSIDRAAAHSVPFDLSIRTFCHCVFRPLKISRWFLLSMAFWNLSVGKALLSAWYYSTVTW